MLHRHAGSQLGDETVVHKKKERGQGLDRIVVANDADVTPPVWPLSVRSPAPLAAPQTRAVRSSLAVTTRAPSGLNAADKMLPLCPWRRMGEPWPSARQTRAVPSYEPVRMREPPVAALLESHAMTIRRPTLDRRVDLGVNRMGVPTFTAMSLQKARSTLAQLDEP